jgi:hypothetical protein
MSALHLAVHSNSGSNEEWALETVKTLLGHHAQAAATNHRVSQAYHAFLEIVCMLLNGNGLGIFPCNVYKSTRRCLWLSRLIWGLGIHLIWALV